MEDRFWTKSGVTQILDLPGWRHGDRPGGEEFCGTNVTQMIADHGLIRADLPDNCHDDCLVILITKDEEGEDFCVSWLLLAYVGTDGGGENFYEFQATGQGYAGALREARHTYIRPYLFYIRPELFTAAFSALAKWFDFY